MSAKVWVIKARYAQRYEDISVDPKSTWGAFKAKAQEIFGLKAENQKVICRGKKVENDGIIGATKGARNKARVMIIGTNSEDLKSKSIEDPNKPFKKGDPAVYKGEEAVIVVGAHFDDPEEIYYTIKRADGSERQTVPKYLKRPDNPSTGPAVQAEKKSSPKIKTTTSPEPPTDSKKPKTKGNQPPAQGEYVVVFQGKETYYIPVALEKDTVGSIKSKVQRILGIPSSVIRLVSPKLTRANDSTMLSATKIRHKSKIMLLFKEGFHIVKYGEDMIRKTVKEVEEAEGLANSMIKRLEHRAIGFAEGIQMLGRLKESVSNIHRTLEGVTVKRASEKMVESLKGRLKDIRKLVKEIEQLRSEFG